MNTMQENIKVLALDFGASSGRAIIGTFNGEKIEIQEIHRFANEPVNLNGTFYWDVLRLFHEIKISLIKAKSYGMISSIGIDTWGVDFGLLDKNGQLLANPIHYRDKRTQGMVQKVLRKIEGEKVYQITGTQFMELNTLFQLCALKEKDPVMLKNADVLLLMPDLFNYFLTGKKRTEQSIASTTQCFEAIGKKWSKTIFDTLNLPTNILTEIVPSGTVIGKTQAELNLELGIEPITVVAVAGHDTQSALVAVPAQEKDFAFLSCGTWSLLGTELNKPLISSMSKKLNLTNEAAFGNKTSLLKNITGLWIIQECKRYWEKQGFNYSFAELNELSLDAKPFKCFIDPDDEDFSKTGDLPERIKEYCLKTKQLIPQSIGEIVRCINESLAMKYKTSLKELEEATEKNYPIIYMVGGGIKNALLCQMTANATNRTVSAGPVEATALGNIVVQMMALGKIKELETARKIIKCSETVESYKPQNTEAWESAFHAFEKIIKETK